MTIKNAPLSLKITPSLKGKLQKIAKEKDTSLNDMSSQIFAEFVENYELEQVKDDEIPSAEELRSLIEKKEEVLINEYHNKIKATIRDMAHSACDGMAFDLFKGDNLSSHQKKIILTSLVNKLTSLGYFTHIFTKDSKIGTFPIKADYLAISITEENINHFKAEEEKNQEIKTDC